MPLCQVLHPAGGCIDYVLCGNTDKVDPIYCTQLYSKRQLLQINSNKHNYYNIHITDTELQKKRSMISQQLKSTLVKIFYLPCVMITEKSRFANTGAANDEKP